MYEVPSQLQQQSVLSNKTNKGQIPVSSLIKDVKNDTNQVILNKENGAMNKNPKQPAITLLNQFSPMSIINCSNVDMSTSSDAPVISKESGNSVVTEIISCYSILKDNK